MTKIQFIKDKPCRICGHYMAVDAHHIKTPRIRFRGETNLIPLCKNHHQGNYSPHGKNRKEFLDDYPIQMQLEDAIILHEEYLNE